MIVVEDYRFFSRILPAASSERACRLSIIVEARKVVFFFRLDYHPTLLSDMSRFRFTHFTSLIVLYVSHPTTDAIFSSQRYGNVCSSIYHRPTTSSHHGSKTLESWLVSASWCARICWIASAQLAFMINLKSFSRNISNSIQMSGLAKIKTYPAEWYIKLNLTIPEIAEMAVSVIWMTAKKTHNKLE